MKVNFTSFLVTEGMIYAAILVCVGISLGRISAGTLALSDALTVLLLSYSFFSSIRQLMGATHNALTAVAAAGKVEEILKTDTSRPYRPEVPMEPDTFRGIELRQVDFHYEGREQTLKGIDLRVEKGKVTALAGLSGCGKSTIASLILKFSDPDSGRILIEGRDYLTFRPEELRKRVAMVPQTVSLFSGSIRENLLIAAPEATDEMLLQVLSEVALLDFVEKEPKGLDTDVGDAGARLSGGQKQKIGIARALLSNAEYIVFDEATSSVDPESEQEIWSCIRRLSLTRTLIIISHRLSSIAEADCIYMIERGRIAEKGTHETLMAKKGIYYQMVLSQEGLQEVQA